MNSSPNNTRPHIMCPMGQLCINCTQKKWLLQTDHYIIEKEMNWSKRVEEYFTGKNIAWLVDDLIHYSRIDAERNLRYHYLIHYFKIQPLPKHNYDRFHQMKRIKTLYNKSLTADNNKLHTNYRKNLIYYILIEDHNITDTNLETLKGYNLDSRIIENYNRNDKIKYLANISNEFYDDYTRYQGVLRKFDLITSATSSHHFFFEIYDTMEDKKKYIREEFQIKNVIYESEPEW